MPCGVLVPGYRLVCSVRLRHNGGGRQEGLASHETRLLRRNGATIIHAPIDGLQSEYATEISVRA